MRRQSPRERFKCLNFRRRRARKLKARRLRAARDGAAWRAARRIDEERTARHQELFEASAEGIARIALAPTTRRTRSGRWYRYQALSAPADFQLQSNLEGVLAFVYELRRQVFLRRRFGGHGARAKPDLYIDLDPILEIDIEGALVLAAELDRVRRVLRIRAVMDDENWHPFVRWFLHGVGLYNVIEAERLQPGCQIEDFEAVAAEVGLRVIPFVSCTKADPGKALHLREELYRHCVRPGDETQMKVYEALVEAFNNAVGHAYRPDVEGDGLPRIGRWWAGALIDQKRGYLYMVVYDQGVGIPATLPRRRWWEIIAGRIPEFSDAAVIQGALEYGRSGVSDDALFGDEADGRGNGLWRMCELADTFDEADVRFTSLKGDVLYAKGGGLERTNLKTRFPGTLIRWRTKLPALNGVAE